jgi:hypothetical protein
MAKLSISTKRIQIDKAKAIMLSFVVAASFIFVFSMIASKSLWSQRGYYNRVITQKAKAKTQLDSNLQSVQSLVGSYQQFIGTTENIIGGDPKGSGDRDGDNAKIILDALPSKYDFPALATSLEKILVDRNYELKGITGTDDELNQQKQTGSGTPTPVEMPFQINIGGSYPAMQGLITVFERSIRPFQIDNLKLSGSETSMTLQVTGKTYYQPGKSLNIITKDIK